MGWNVIYGDNKFGCISKFPQFYIVGRSMYRTRNIMTRLLNLTIIPRVIKEDPCIE